MLIFAFALGLFLFLGFGWLITREMIQHRSWRKKLEGGDDKLVAVLINQALSTWQKSKTPNNFPSTAWSSLQRSQLVAVTESSANISTSCEPSYRTVKGQREQISSALDEAIPVAAKLIDQLFFDVPNLQLERIRIDIFTTFPSKNDSLVQQPILTTTAIRSVAKELKWDTISEVEVLIKFTTHYAKSPDGGPITIVLPEVEGRIIEQGESI